MFKLRPYQITALSAIHKAMKTQPNVLLSAIMGSGKTVMVCRLINRYYKETDRNFLILAHKKELVEQFRKTFLEKTDIPARDIGIACAGLGQRKTKSRVIIGTVQTFFNLIGQFDCCSLLVVDEAHRIEIGKDSQYDQIIKDLQSKNDKLRILGITATPYRLGLGYCYGKYNNAPVLFPECNHKITYNELKESGYLMPLQGMVKMDNSYQKDIEDVRTSGDYVLDQLGEMMVKTIHLQTAVDAIYEHCQDYKFICVFCCTIDHAEKLKDLLGDECTTVHSKLTDWERQHNMDQWKEGKKRIITSVNILVEGFDFPPLDCLVMARPTLSTALFLQAVGRVLRISEGKKRAFLLDLTDNTDRFGTDLDNVTVQVPKKVGELIKKEKKYFKDCPECGIECHVVCIDCPECGYEWPAQEYEEATNIPELKTVSFEPEPPEEWPVDNVEWKRHTKKDKPDSVRIDYFNNDVIKYNRFGGLIPIASEWLCFDHGGYATKKAHEWWDKMHVSKIPESTEHALEILDNNAGLAIPSAIMIQKDGNFKRVVNHFFNDSQKEKALQKYEDDIPF